MNRPLALFASVALLGASLFPMSVSAAPDVPHAVCTQIEPIYRRNGVSFYNGTATCEIIAAVPDAFGWMAVPLDPGPSFMTPVCTYFVSSAHDEYAVAWSQPGYESVAADWCYTMRIGGVDITFVDINYS
jgi:hypothetical protein